MADNKRNSTTTRVATPRSPATPPQADNLETLSKAIGARIKVTTNSPAGTTIEGSLFTACTITNVVAIDTHTQSSTTTNGAASYTGDYHIIPFSRIQSFQILSLSTNGNSVVNATPAIAAVDTKRVQDRLDARVKKLKEEEANRGKGVTKQAQAIFDALKRVNIPIRWHDQQMVAHEAVIISPPYRAEDCKGGKDKQQVLSQVRRVLEGETKKLKEREERDRRAATPTAGQRKGG